MSELTKYWDGYDNQPIVWIDDPGEFDMKFHPEEVAAFKNVISNGPHTVEIKYGSMQFDSKLCIITTNLTPGRFLRSSGPNFDALDRRIGRDSIIGAPEHCSSLEYCKTKLYKHAFKIIAQIARVYFNIELDVNYLINVLPPIMECKVVYSSEDSDEDFDI